MGFKGYKQNINESINYQTKLQTLIYLSEQDLDSMNESDLNEGVNDWLGKVGLKLHKGDGILDYIKQFTTGSGKLVMAALKGDKDKVKEIARSLDRSKVIDFLLKLDMATLHLVTGPIHFVDAVTGWDLMANLKGAAKQAKNLVDVFKDAILKVKDSAMELFSGKQQQRVLSNIKRIETLKVK